MKKQVTILVAVCILAAAGLIFNFKVWSAIPAMSDKYSSLDNENKQYAAQIEESASNRELTFTTKLLRLNPFIEKVTDKLNNLKNDGKVSAFIAMDGDKFGTLKNQFGDEAVDNIVITLTDLLKKHFDDKENDLICNVGENSDELYLFLMNRNDIDEIEKEVSDFMEEFRNTDVEYSGGTIKATCSAGIAICPRDGSDFQTLYEAADTALYDAKEGGRDRYAVYAGE